MLRMRMRGRGPVLSGTSSPAHCWEVSSRSGKALAARLASRFQTLRIFHRCLLFSAIPSCALGSQPQTLPNRELSHNKAKSTLKGNQSTSTRPCYPFPVLRCEEERVQKGKNYKVELRSRKLEEQTLQTRWTAQT
ncbi:PREDICTED: transmembrane protein 14A isoform X1 [Capra hircus]|uniref:transmembrane protein 14A isoform X1 n=1 Tax=Capra hircus TaxID=9925 RepID=UPI0008473CD8|nr:PREDICTED: transmembrane protein 14A isoform X1 [Capra hircus]